MRARKSAPGGFEKEVVLKQLLPEFTSRPEFRDLFFREAKISATLDHQNIVRTFDLVNSNDRLFIVMEYVRGADLRTIAWRARRRKPLSPQAILHVAMEISGRARLRAGSALAHGRAAWHHSPRSSPSNILCSGEGEVKLSDFGIAKAVTYSSVFYRVRGKVGYMSPEMARNQPLDARSDLFSLGVSIYETLIGERIYTGDLNTPPDKIYAQTVPLLATKCPGLPPESAGRARPRARHRSRRALSRRRVFRTALRQVANEQRCSIRRRTGGGVARDHGPRRGELAFRPARSDPPAQRARAQAPSTLAGHEVDSLVSRARSVEPATIRTSRTWPRRRPGPRLPCPWPAAGRRPRWRRRRLRTSLRGQIGAQVQSSGRSAAAPDEGREQVTPPPPMPLPPAVPMLNRAVQLPRLPFRFLRFHLSRRAGGVAAIKRSRRGLGLLVLLAACRVARLRLRSLLHRARRSTRGRMAVRIVAANRPFPRPGRPCMEGVTASITRLITKDAAIFRQSGRGRFIVIRGPDRGDSLVVGQSPITLGSGSGSDVRLSDPTISRRHLSVTLAESGVVVRDLGSTNGSFVGGARFQELLLGFGAEIQIGQTLLKYLPDEETSTSRPRPASASATWSAAIPRCGRCSACSRTWPHSEATVLLEGETGTGKELSPRKSIATARAPTSPSWCSTAPRSRRI